MFRPRQAGRMGPVPGPQLHKALQLLAGGRYAEAGELFGRLADRARDNGHPIRAAHLSAQAGRAFLEAGNGEQALAYARQAIGQFVAGKRPGQAVKVLRRMATALRGRGLGAQADALEQEAQARLAEIGLSLASIPAEPALQPRGQLPPTCSQCGGPLRPDEVEWIDATLAECPYCGITVRTR